MSENYDAIVIGSGLGGLTAGALYATDGKRVLVLERHSAFGGAASMFERGGLLIEAGLHEIDGLDPEDSKMWTLDRLGVTGKVDFLTPDILYAVRHPLIGDEFAMPHGQQRVINATIERFPRREAEIRRYLGTLFKLRSQITGLTSTKSRLAFLLHNWLGVLAPFRYWMLFRHDRTTLGGYLDALFGDDEPLKFALAANIGYYTDDPQHLSFIFYAAAQASYLTGGGHYITGGSRSLVNHLIGIIERAGGAARAGRTVGRILVENGRAAGVAHFGSKNDGEERQTRAPVVFGNAAPNLLGEMLPDEHREQFLQPYSHRALSTSLWTIYVGLDCDPAELGLRQYSTFIFPTWLDSFSRVPESSVVTATSPRGRLPAYVLVNYGLLDPGTGDERTQMVSIAGVDRLENWEGLDRQSYKERKAAWIDEIIGDVEQHYPGFAAHVVHKEMATARTIKRFLNTPGGTAYGFAQDPSGAVRNRPRPKTSVPGLLLSSAFAMPGGGFSGTILAGERAYWAARKIKR
jgi:phytoene dehydrogenase-like protein